MRRWREGGASVLPAILFRAHGELIKALPCTPEIADEDDEPVWFEFIATSAPITPEMIENDETLTDAERSRAIDLLFEYAPMDEE